MKTPFFILAVAAILVAGCRATKPEAASTAIVPQPTSSAGSKYALLPRAVQHTITAQAGAAEIKDINKVPGEDQDYYEITFRDSAVAPTLYVAEDGTLLNESAPSAAGAPGDLLGTNAGGGVLSTLPNPVQRTLQLTAPGAVVAEVRRIQGNVYEITFQDPALHPKMYIAEDGRLLKEAP
ncbi:MAG: hypothetical protein JWR69_1670 [Pedosphaera sp.]|nr:hypothetical protein [Pedosphaera sp.]